MALLSGPAYVFLKANGKFIGVKGPFDFFSLEEIQRFSSSETVFFTEFIDRVAPYEDTGRRTRILLEARPQPVPESPLKVALPPAPFEISDAIVHLLGPLWGNESVIEPFFATVFANSLCDALPDEELLAARDKDVVAFELGILRAGTAVFLALHLGLCRLNYLSQLYLAVFRRTSLAGSLAATRRWTREELDLLELCAWLIPDSRSPGAATRLALVGRDLEKCARENAPGTGALTAARLLNRLDRIQTEFAQGVMTAPSIYSSGGFADDGT